MVGPEYWLVCELDLSWRGLRAGEMFLEVGGENLGARARAEDTGGSDAEERLLAEADMLQICDVGYRELKYVSPWMRAGDNV